LTEEIFAKTGSAYVVAIVLALATTVFLKDPRAGQRPALQNPMAKAAERVRRPARAARAVGWRSEAIGPMQDGRPAARSPHEHQRVDDQDGAMVRGTSSPIARRLLSPSFSDRP
jgi:hypothetical protein